MSATRDDYDSPWKEALECYFADFLALLIPWLHERINWDQPPIFLDRELQAIKRDSRAGRRYADKLVRVQSKSQQSIWILIHIEVQGGMMAKRALKDFGERMFQYFCRINDHYHKALIDSNGKYQKAELISLGVLTASANNENHLVHFQGNLQTCSVQFRFPVVHLASWLECWSELEQRAAGNPFSLVVMAQLQAQKTRKNGLQRLASKTQITRLMYRHQYDRKNVLQLFRLIDWMMALPAELEPAFEQAIITIEQEYKMAFVTSIERLGEKRGLEKGLEKGRYYGLREGEALMLQRQLTCKFGPLSEAQQQRILTATPTQLETWSLNILDAEKLEDVFT